ncbi:unnamed protein product [Orchesella dallaii]|uniref:Uncharacterized protein n=1 Tax=Orchesella dallaii TaxID=48710 RepID=A0ABP1R5G7_9HEXA
MMKLIISYLISVIITLSLASKPEMYSIQPGMPTLVDVPYFNSSADADFIKEAIKTLDVWMLHKLAHIGSMRSRKQRVEILETLKERHSVDLVKEYMSRRIFDGQVGVLVQALFMSRAEFLAREVRWAIDGLGTDENTLTDIFCCLDPNEISYFEIEKAYKRLYKPDDMSHDITMDVAGPYRRLLWSLRYQRHNKTNDTNAKLIADTYFNNDINTTQFLKMEDKYTSYLSLSSYDEIRLTSKYFRDSRGISLGSYLSNITTLKNHGFFTSNYWWLNFAGKNLPGLVMSIMNYSNDKIGYYVDLIRTGFNEGEYRRLIRAVALRADIDLELVKLRFKSEYRGNRINTLVSEALNLSSKFVHPPREVNFIRMLLIKVMCGNRDPDRDLDMIQRWDKTKGYLDTALKTRLDRLETLDRGSRSCLHAEPFNPY